MCTADAPTLLPQLLMMLLMRLLQCATVAPAAACSRGAVGTGAAAAASSAPVSHTAPAGLPATVAISDDENRRRRAFFDAGDDHSSGVVVLRRRVGQGAAASVLCWVPCKRLKTSVPMQQQSSAVRMRPYEDNSLLKERSSAPCAAAGPGAARP